MANLELKNSNWSCPKCNTSSVVIAKKDKDRSRDSISQPHTSETVSMTSGGFTKFFNVQNQIFHCSNQLFFSAFSTVAVGTAAAYAGALYLLLVLLQRSFVLLFLSRVADPLQGTYSQRSNW